MDDARQASVGIWTKGRMPWSQACGWGWRRAMSWTRQEHIVTLFGTDSLAVLFLSPWCAVWSESTRLPKEMEWQSDLDSSVGDGGGAGRDAEPERCLMSHDEKPGGVVWPRGRSDSVMRCR